MHYDYSWDNLPAGFDTELFDSRAEQFSFKDIQVMAAVCKRWRSYMESQPLGNWHLKKMHIKPHPKLNWLSHASACLRTSRLIFAIDVSGSMQDIPLDVSVSNFGLAVTKACHMADQESDILTYYGVDCLVFSDQVRSCKVYSAKEMQDFIVNNNMSGRTDLFQLFKNIFSLHEKYQSEGYSHTAQVNIFSDFDAECRLEKLIENNKRQNIDFKCYRHLGSSNSYIADNVHNFFEQFNIRKRKRDQEDLLNFAVAVIDPSEIEVKELRPCKRPRT